MIFQRTITKENPCKICFVCFANICRSPIAEGIFRSLVEERGLSDYFVIDSAGISAEPAGEKADQNSRWIARKHGIELRSVSRQFQPSDLDKFDLILAMDHKNFDSLQEMDLKELYSGKIYLVREFDPEPGTKAVPDPDISHADVLQDAFNILHRSCKNLLEKLEEQINHDHPSV